MNQCWNCAAFTHEPADWDTGLSEVFICEAAIISEDDAEGVPDNFRERMEIMMQSLYFTLSSINNCPEYVVKRKSILDLKPPSTLKLYAYDGTTYHGDKTQ